MTILKHSLFLCSEVTRPASKIISTANRGKPCQEGRTSITQLTQLVAQPREPESSVVFHTPLCYCLPLMLAFSARCSPSLQSRVIRPPWLKVKLIAIKNLLLPRAQVTANHVSVACKQFFFLEGKDIPELGAHIQRWQ